MPLLQRFWVPCQRRPYSSTLGPGQQGVTSQHSNERSRGWNHGIGSVASGRISALCPTRACAIQSSLGLFVSARRSKYVPRPYCLLIKALKLNWIPILVSTISGAYKPTGTRLMERSRASLRKPGWDRYVRLVYDSGP
jgi:hypothetical protein